MAFYFIEYGSHYAWGCSLGLDPSLTSANGTLWNKQSCGKARSLSSREHVLTSFSAFLGSLSILVGEGAVHGLLF